MSEEGDKMKERKDKFFSVKTGGLSNEGCRQKEKNKEHPPLSDNQLPTAWSLTQWLMP